MFLTKSFGCSFVVHVVTTGPSRDYEIHGNIPYEMYLNRAEMWASFSRVVGVDCRV